MINTPTTEMKKVILQILVARGLFAKFQDHKHFYARIENDPFMPLTIEKHDTRIIVAHYFLQDYDLVPDPDMELEVGSDGAWYPVATQMAIGTYRRCTDAEGRINLRERKDQASFANMWARNLKAQGFLKGEVVTIHAEN